MRYIVTAILALGLGGCGYFGYVKPTEGDRQVNHQNMGAGAFIEATAEEPEIKQAGADVRENALALEANLIGKPEQPTPYSPQASADTRKKSTEEHSTPWWQVLLGGLATFIAGGGAFRILARVAPVFFGGPIGGALTAVVEGIARARETIRSRPEGQRHLSEEDLLAALRQAQENPKIREVVKDLAHKVEAKLATRQ
jgi:hypothetical protein